MKNFILVDAAGMNRLNGEEIGKAILATATVVNPPDLLPYGLTILEVTDQALEHLLVMFKYGVMKQISGSFDQKLTMVSDAPIIYRAIIKENEKWWVLDNRTGETVVTIDMLIID